jgi:hypothetical protein
MFTFIKQESIFIVGVALLALLIAGASYAQQGTQQKGYSKTASPAASTAAATTSIGSVWHVVVPTTSTPEIKETPPPAPAPIRVPRISDPEQEYDD